MFILYKNIINYGVVIYMNIKILYDENGKDLQDIMEEFLVDFYYEYYE